MRGVVPIGVAPTRTVAIVLTVAVGTVAALDAAFAARRAALARQGREAPARVVPASPHALDACPGGTRGAGYRRPPCPREIRTADSRAISAP